MDLPALRRPHVVMGLLFFPRGGSAQVTRSLAHALLERCCPTPWWIIR
jgi:hypothetical protein